MRIESIRTRFVVIIYLTSSRAHFRTVMLGQRIGSLRVSLLQPERNGWQHYMSCQGDCIQGRQPLPVQQSGGARTPVNSSGGPRSAWR